jgi:hypothetical protein
MIAVNPFSDFHKVRIATLLGMEGGSAAQNEKTIFFNKSVVRNEINTFLCTTDLGGDNREFWRNGGGRNRLFIKVINCHKSLVVL